jgi:hypothetical protein
MRLALLALSRTKSPDTEKTMTEEKNATPVVAPVAGPVLSQAPALTAKDVKPIVDKPSSVIAPTVVGQR